MENNVIEKAEYLKETKNLIKQALQEQGADVSDADPFRAFASIILRLNTGSGGDDVVKVRTGEEIAEMTQDDTMICLCTTDYLYTDSTGIPVQCERGVIYEIVEGIIVDRIVSSGGGGGGTPRSNFTETISDLEQKISINSTVNLKYKFVTTAIPNTGTAKLYVNNVLKSTKSVVSGNIYSFNITSYIKSGMNYFTIKTTDSNGAEKTLEYIINAIELGITSTFTGNSIYEPYFSFIYTLTGSGEKLVHFIIDDIETTEIHTETNTAINKKFTGFSHGQHSLKVFVTMELGDETLTSNELFYKFLVADPTVNEPLIMSNFDTAEATEGDLLSIDYLVYDSRYPKVNVELQINGETQLTTEVDRTRKYWNITNYPIGEVVFSIVAGSVRVDKKVIVNKLDIDLKPVKDNLALYLTAANRSNQETDDTRSTWKYEDITAELNDFNWVSDGWIDGALKFKGKANGYIPLTVFADDARITGKTIEVEFTTHDAFNHDAILLSCFTESKGFEIHNNYCVINSEQTSVTAKYNEESRIRIAFVIESMSSVRLIRTYINGVLSGLTQYSETDNFQQNSPVGITINPNQEEFDIHCIRIYNRELTSTEVLHNYIYDIPDNTTKIQLYTNNLIYDDYGNVSYTKMKARMPVLTITGVLPKSKGDKQKVHCLYENINNSAYDFEYDECTIDVQGTSSQYYPRKNWKIKLPEKIKFHENAIEEKTFCFKADYMETSHSHNIGSAIIANSLPKILFPTRKENANIRDTMYGFPCVIFHKETEESIPTFYGTFMFNNDKSNNETLGLTTSKSESWEFCNNTSDHCLFKTNDFSESSGVEDNLEARYPDGYTDYTNIKKLYDWVVSCKDDITKFKNEFKEHLDLEYCLNYLVFMEFAILVDSRAKNMFLDTVDGKIWYPRYYDLDTCWGLNNEGELKYNYDVEIHDKIGSGYVWNDRGESVLWNLFEEAFDDEIKDKYHELRKDKLTYDNLMKVYVEDISSKFVEASYNEDAYFKYILPLIETKDSTYLYAAQGNRIDHFKYILDNRIKYLDSKYEYGIYNNNYATMRLYCKNTSFNINTYTTEYVKIKFGSSIKKSKCVAGEIGRISSPSGLEFNDTETIIYGASEIANLGDLSDKFPGTVDITKCGKLQELIIGPESGQNTNLKSLSLGNNPLLRKLDVRNCPSLLGNLDMSGCTDLREVYLTGSGVTSITLPETSSVETLYLPASLTSLTLKSQKSLKTMNFESKSNIQTIIIKDSTIDNIDDLIFGCPNLSRLNIEFKEGFINKMPLDLLIYFTNNLSGVDDNGYNTDYPGFTGKLTVNIPDHHELHEIEHYKELFKDAYPLLEITYTESPSYFRFYGWKWSGSYLPNGKKQFTKTSVENDIEFYSYDFNSNSIDSPIIMVPEKYKNKLIKAIGEYFNSETNDYSAASITNNDIVMYVIDNNIYDDRELEHKCFGLAFSNVKNLKSVSMKSCKYIEFYSCPKLEYIEDMTKVNYTSISLSGTEPISKNKTLFFPNLSNLGDRHEAIVHYRDVVWENLTRCFYGNYDCSLRFSKNVTNTNSSTTIYDHILDLKETKYFPRLKDITLSNDKYFLEFYYNNFTPKSEISIGHFYGLISHFTYYGTLEINSNNMYNYNVGICRALEYSNLDNIDISTYTLLGKKFIRLLPSIFYIDHKKIMTFSKVTDLSLDMSKAYSFNGSTARGIICGPNLSFPNLKKLNFNMFYNMMINIYYPIARDNIIEYEDRVLDLPENVKIIDSSIYNNNHANDDGPGAGFSFMYYIYSIAMYGFIKNFPMFDCSDSCNAYSRGGYYSGGSANENHSRIKTFKGFKDYGKAFDINAEANKTQYTLGSFREITTDDQSLINILDNVYDIASMGCNPQKIEIGTTYLNRLRNTEEGLAAIERATTKGWTVV